MSPVKEPNHFASEIQLEGFAEPLREPTRRGMEEMQKYLAGPMLEKRFGAVGLTWADYLKLFRNAQQEKAIGEASVCYLWSESAARNIFARIGEAKIIIILRHPAERAFSQYRQWAGKKRMRETFREACEKCIANRGGKFQAMSPFLEMGLYAEQVKRYLELFPRESVRIVFYEDYQRDPAAMIDGTLGFLGVDARFQPDLSRKYLVGNENGCVLTERDRSYLADYYRDDVRKLAQLLDRDLSRWER